MTPPVELRLVPAPGRVAVSWTPAAGAVATEMQIQYSGTPALPWGALLPEAHAAAATVLRDAPPEVGCIVRLRHLDARGRRSLIAQTSAQTSPRIYRIIGGDRRPASAHEVPAPPTLYRALREAWRWPSTGPVEIDMALAREITRTRIRAERTLRWPIVDRDFNIALEKGASIDSAAAIRRRLRDAPAHPSIDAAATPDALARVTLDTILAS